MSTILLTNHYTGEPYSILREVLPPGFAVRFLEEQTEACLCETIPEADYLLAGGRLRITRTVLERASRLNMIQRSGVGLDSLDLDAIQARGIPLYVNQGVNTQSVAEHTLLMILASLRRLTVIHRNTVNGLWSKQTQGVQTDELRGKTVGMIGMGHIGQTLVRLLQPFQVTVLYFDSIRKEALEEEYGVRFASIEELLRFSDIVSLHCSLNSETAGLINEKTIGLMKPGAILVNTARGGLIVTQALEGALSSGKLAFAGLDVHESEPIPEDYPLKTMDNVILTPHIAGVTRSSFRTMMHDAFRNIVCFDAGKLEEIQRYRYL